MPKKTIKLKFVDFRPGFEASSFVFWKLLQENYDVALSDNPDYIVYSVFGKDHLKYKCIRIFYTAENQVPDFNICDYAVGFQHIAFEDRYIRFPNYLLYKYKNAYELALEKHWVSPRQLTSKTGFCSFIYSNASASPQREQFFQLLGRYKRVDSGGKFLNNIGSPVADKLEFQSKYKFSIAFENASANGYTTEKILQAFAAQAIPLYWGNPKIAEEFNPASFINCHEYNNFEDVIARIKELDSNDSLFLQMLQCPVFAKEPAHVKIIPALRAFLYNIMDQDLSSAYRRNRQYWCAAYERRLIRDAKLSSAFKKIDGLFNPIRKAKNLFMRSLKRRP